MRIAFNPSTVAALIAPPNNKDITFDLRGQNIFARGVKFCGTDTNTWRDIKINNVSIDSNILDLRDGDNTTLTNINGVVTINSTWRPVVDNLTSDSTTSSLSANLGRVLKALIDGKSDSDHNHDDRYLRLTGGLMLGDITFGGDNKICWGRNTDSASISFKNDGDGDADSYMSFVTSDNGNEYFRWSHSSGSTNTEWMSLRSDGLRVGGTKVSLEGHTHDDRYVKRSGDTMLGALNFANGIWNLVGDDSYMGDCNVSGHFGIKAANTTYPGIAFFNNANDHLGNLTAYNGNVKYGAYSLQFLDNGNTSVSASTWMNPFNTYDANAVTDGQAICVWGQSSSLSNLAADTGDISLWLKRVNANVATLNMVLDGEYYANGNLRLAHVSEIPNSLKNPYALTISLNGTSQGPYDGSAAKNINITPSSIGAATSDHNHDGRYVYNYGGTANVNGLALNQNALFMSTTSGITEDWWHILQAAWNDEYRWNSLIAFPTLNRNGMYYRSGLDDNTTWGAWVKLLDVNNYSSTLDSRYYTESEIDSLLDAKLDRQNLSYGTWNPRGYNLAADYSYNGGDLSISESGGLIHVSVDGYFWLNEGLYRVLDTSDIGSIQGSITILLYLSNTDTNWYPLIWGGNDHRNTYTSTGGIYKSHDVLSWLTSSLTLYATHLQTTYIDLQNNRGISLVTSGSTSPYKGIRLPDLQSNGIGIFSRVDNSSDEGGIVLSENTCVIYNSFDTGWGLSVRDKDRNQTDISGDDTIAFGVRQDYRAYSLGGFEKSGSDNSYVLLGGGGHKAESSLRVEYASSAGNADTVDGYHATDGRTFTGNINWSGNWDDTWSDGTNKHPWYGFDHRYPNTGAYSTTLTDYFGMTIKTANTLRLDFGTLLLNGTSIYSINVASATKLQTPRSIWGQYFDGTADVSGNMSSVGLITFSALSGTNGRALLYLQMADNDFFRIYIGATASNSGYAEIATADDGNEPIYVRQYSGVFNSVVRTLTLLDANGYTHFPSYINIGGNENNNSSPDRVWGSNSSDSYLRSYRTSALSVANADTVDGYHENSFLRYRGATSTDLETTLWNLIGIKEYYGALPDGLTDIYNWGGVISLPGTYSRFEIYAAHSASSGTGLYYRSGWDSDKKTWLKFIDSSNIGSQSVNYANSAGYASSAGNAETLGGMPRNYDQAPFNKIPCIGSDGVMEIGRYIDFHYDNSGNYDFSTRLYASGNNRNVVALPSESGTLALTSYGGDNSHPIFLGYLNLEHGNNGTVSSSFYCLGYSVSFTYTRGGNYCKIYIPDTSYQAFYIRAATASVNYSGGGMDTWTGYRRGDGAWWLHCYAYSSNEVRVKGFRQANDSNDSWWGGNPLIPDNGGANRITVCIFGYVTFR